MPESLTPFRVFVGYDERAPVQYHVLCQSILAKASVPVTVAPLMLDTLPMTRRGLTQFTYSRFLVPWLCGFKGWAAFLDSDMLVTGDIADLFALGERGKAIHVRKSPWKFEWASVMLFNCAHKANRILTPEYIEDPEQCRIPHHIDWLKEAEIGDLPRAWNYLCLYEPMPPDVKLIHYTGGIPMFAETRGCPGTDEWLYRAKEATSTVPWAALMGNSVHRDIVARFNRERVGVPAG